MAEVQAYRRGDHRPRLSACVLTVSRPDQRVIDKLCCLTHAKLFNVESTFDSGVSCVDVSDRKEAIRDAVSAMRVVGSLNRDAAELLSGVTVGMMVKSSRAFLDLFYKISGKRFGWRTKDLAERKARSSVITSQYARRALADAWIRCMALGEKMTTTDEASDSPEWVHWMLAGPIWSLGRYGAIQAVLGALEDDDALGSAHEILAAARHVAILREERPSGVTYSLMTVPDEILTQALAAILSDSIGNKRFP